MAKSISTDSIQEIFHTLDFFPCLKLCLKLENSYFARKCRENLGYFKCCLDYFIIETFELVRNKLIREGLMHGRQTTFCKGRESGMSKCRYCTMGAMCSKKNPVTGFVDSTFFKDLGKGRHFQTFFFIKDEHMLVHTAIISC